MNVKKLPLEKKKRQFLSFFDIQMAIFRRVSLEPWSILLTLSQTKIPKQNISL